ncbi:MAG: hypothetical protein V4529_16650 [Gemmatimonadota bacterium]
MGTGTIRFANNKPQYVDPSGVNYPIAYGIAISVLAFGSPNGKYINPADGKLYRDASFITEADDDAQKLQQAIDYVYSQGGGSVFLPPGYFFYLKDAPTGPKHEFVIPRSGVSVLGDGDSSYVLVGPGHTTVASGGYSAVFGLLDSGSPATRVFTSNVQFRNFCVDHNSDFNQFENAAYGGVTYSHSASIAIQSGDNITVDNVTHKNCNGPFDVLLGQYSDPTLTTNVRVTNGRHLHLADDPHAGDASRIACGATGVVIANNRFDGGAISAATLATFPRCRPGTAIEYHGFGAVISGNNVTDMQRFLNLAGDQADYGDIDVSGNVATSIIQGITLYQGFGTGGFRIAVHGNQFNLKQGGASGESGIDVAPNSTIGWTDGKGFHDVKIHSNTIVFTTGTATPGFSWGMTMEGNCGVPGVGGGVEIYNNKISGFASGAIRWGTACTPNTGIAKTVTRSGNNLHAVAHGFVAGNAFVYTTSGGAIGGLTAGHTYYVVATVSADDFRVASSPSGTPITLTSAGTGTHTATQAASNIINDLQIHHNSIANCGTVGVFVTASTSEVAAVATRLTVRQNDVVDSQSVATLQYGAYIQALTDANMAMWYNKVLGHTVAAEYLDTVNYPAAGSYKENLAVRSAQGEVNNLGTTLQAAFQAVNNTAAAAGAQQWSPGLKLTGQGWKTDATGASKQVDFYQQVEPIQGAAEPSGRVRWIWQIDGAGGGAETTVGWLTSAGQVLLVADLVIGAATSITYNAGSPESVVAANLGSLCCDTTNGELYVKKTGSGNTGWKLVTHA